MDLLSIIIPSRNGQPYTQQTIDGLLKHAEGPIEIIVVCDGVWPSPPLRNDPHVTVLHHGTVHQNIGMRDSINRGIAISKGKYIMKIDEHCMVDQGFDTKLKSYCAENWVVIPRRYRLLADNEPWRIEEYILENGQVIPDPQARHVRPPVDYMYLAYPYERAYDKTCGLHGAEWRERYETRKDILIDDTMSWQGSCYFTTRKYWDFLFPQGLEPEQYGQFTQEAQEIGNTVWLSGGRLVVNKKTWYAHMHKGKKGKGYGFSNEQYQKHMEGTERGRLYCIDYWVNNKHLADKRMIHSFEWLLEKFWPVPTWPENWKERIEIDKLTDYSLLRQQRGDI